MLDIEETKAKTVHIERSLAQKAFTKATAALSLQQKKILFYLISNVGENDECFCETEISIHDYFRLTGVEEGGMNRKMLQKEIQSFADKSFWIRVEDEDILYRWIRTAKINMKKGIIKLKLDDDMKPFLLNLVKQSRAIFQVGYALLFKYKYSPDIYLFASSIKDFLVKHKSLYIMTYEEAAKKFGDGKYLRDSSKWKSKVMEPSLSEINAKTDLNVSVEYFKKDKRFPRKVTHVGFAVMRKVGKELEKVRIKALSTNPDQSVYEEAKEFAQEHIERYAANELNMDVFGMNTDEIIYEIEKYEKVHKK